MTIQKEAEITQKLSALNAELQGVTEPGQTTEALVSNISHLQLSVLDDPPSGLSEVDGQIARGEMSSADQTLMDLIAFDQYKLGKVRELEGEFDLAEKSFRLATGAEPNNILYLRALADLLTTLGKYSAAEPVYQQIVNLDKTDVEAHRDDYALALSNLAVTQMALDDNTEGLANFTEARRMASSPRSTNKLVLAWIDNDFGTLIVQNGRTGDAEQYLNEAKSIEAEYKDTAPAQYFSTLVNLADLYTFTAQFDKADAVFGEIQQFEDAKIPSYYPMRDIWLIDYANVRHYEGRESDAEEIVQNAEKSWKSELMTDHPNFIDLYGVWGDIEFWSGRARDAEIEYGRALQIALSNFGHQSVAVARYEISMSRAESAQSNIGGAQNSLNDARYILRNVRGYDRMLTSYVNRAAGELAAAGRNWEQSVVLLQSAAADFKEFLPGGHPEWVLTMYELAAAYEGAGSRAAAIGVLEETMKIAETSLKRTHPLYIKMAEMSAQLAGK